MEHAKDMDLRGMLDDVGHEQNKIGKIQSFSYEVTVNYFVLPTFVSFVLGEAFLQEVILQPWHKHRSAT